MLARGKTWRGCKARAEGWLVFLKHGRGFRIKKQNDAFSNAGALVASDPGAGDGDAGGFGVVRGGRVVFHQLENPAGGGVERVSRLGGVMRARVELDSGDQIAGMAEGFNPDTTIRGASFRPKRCFASLLGDENRFFAVFSGWPGYRAGRR
jgi:hypothetical protein